jgi:hypothetical protein
MASKPDTMETKAAAIISRSIRSTFAVLHTPTPKIR